MGLLGVTSIVPMLHAESNAPSQIMVAAAGDLRGEIKPCGCSADGDMGGLLRRSSYVQQLRQQHDAVLLLDLGNNFPVPSEQGHLKLQLVQDALKVIAPHAILPGPQEWKYGLNRWDTELPYVVGNLPDNPDIQRKLEVELAGQKVLITGFVSPELIYHNKNEPSILIPTGEALQQWLNSTLSSQQDAVRVLLFRGDPTQLDWFVKQDWFDLIIAGNHSDNELSQEVVMKTAQKEIPIVPTKGQGVLEGALRSQKLAAGFKTIWLYDKFGDDVRLAKFYDEYNEEVKQLFFKQLEAKMKAEEESKFAGAQSCQACHTAEHAIWQNSRHGNAFATLEKVHKHYDPECVQCHVVGMDQGGYLSAELTPQFKDVQCENCHGASKAHVADPSKNKTPQDPSQQCTTCHHGSHSPNFTFDTYWPKIFHVLTAPKPQ